MRSRELRHQRYVSVAAQEKRMALINTRFNRMFPMSAMFRRYAPLPFEGRRPRVHGILE